MMEKISKQSNQIQQHNQTARPELDSQAELPSQSAKKHFSSTLKKSEAKINVASKKTRHSVDKTLSNVQRRLSEDSSDVNKAVTHDATNSRAGIKPDTGTRHQIKVKKTSEAVADSADFTDARLANAGHVVTQAATEATLQAGQDLRPAAHDIGKIAQQIADRVLVSVPDSKDNLGGRSEVRIQLKSSFLDGSDVRIFREGGELKIVFIASSKDVENFIAQNKANIEQALANRLKDEKINISIETQDGRASSGEENEGRSRQQYIAPEDDQT